MRRVLLLCLILFAAVFALLLNCVEAQNPARTRPATEFTDKQELLSVTVLSVKPEMLADFQNFTRAETNPALRKGGQKWRDVWRTTGAAGDPFEFIIVSPIDNLKQYEGQTPLLKALGKQGFEAWEEKSYRFVNTARRYIIRTRPDLSHQSKRTSLPRLAVVTSITVAPGQSQDWENYTKNDYVPVMRQAGATYLMTEIVFGGNPNIYISLILRDSYAEIDKGPLPVQVLGIEGAAKLERQLPTGVVVHTEQSILRYVPELSIF